jgi:hypothetical protein
MDLLNRPVAWFTESRVVWTASIDPSADYDIKSSLPQPAH